MFIASCFGGEILDLSGSASAEPQAPVEEPHGTGRRGERGCRRHRRQEEERVGRAGSAGGAEEVRVQMQVQVQSWPMTTTTMPVAARTLAPGGFLEGESGISPSVYGARTRCVEEPKPTAQATPVFLAARGLVKAWYRVTMFGGEGPSLVAIPGST
uniref:Uncharacterized protein n=1 Tax=Oryza rufipogon TaxID=4529 RepID=A0A0E0NZ43_ORYRU